MKLTDYIQKHYNGNKTAFANDNNTTKQAVWGMEKKGYYHVVNGYLVMMKTKLKIHEGE